MSANPLYLGIDGTPGGTVQFGAGFFGTAAVNNVLVNTYQPYIEPWEVSPAGESGVCVFRGITASFFVQSGYQLTIVPVVDGKPLTAVAFSEPTGGDKVCEAAFIARGRRIGAQCTFSGYGAPNAPMIGDLKYRNLQYTYAVVRKVPA